MGIILSLSIVGPLMKATTFINEAKSMEYAVEAANELLNLPVLPDSGKIVSIPHNDIALKHVTFSYDGSEQNEVLHDVNLELPEGSFTALVGPSGGGKSTIARLIARFWDVTGGNITIGGKNIKELSIRQLSELVSFVTQDNFLFNCSLKENIRLGNPNATDEEVYAAAKAAAVMNLLCVWTKDMIPLPVMPERGCPAAKNSELRLRGRSSKMPRLLFWMKRQHLLTRRTKIKFRNLSWRYQRVKLFL